MARRYEHAHEESRQGRTTRGAAVLAGGALVFASLVAATSPAAAEDALPSPSFAAPSPVGDSGNVVGLVVEHSATSAARVGSAARSNSFGVAAATTTVEPGVSKITFDEPTDTTEA